jgi:T-complex protein 1 subunit theta
MNYNKGEEKMMEDTIKSIADSGTNVIVCGGSVSEMAVHFIEKYNIMLVKVTSKWELRRLCQAVHATALVRLGPATADEMGECERVEVQEIGLKKVRVCEES